MEVNHQMIDQSNYLIGELRQVPVCIDGGDGGEPPDDRPVQLPHR